MECFHRWLLILTLGWLALIRVGTTHAEATRFVTEEAEVERIFELADQATPMS